MRPSEELLTPEEVAEHLRISRQTVYRHLRKGLLPGIKVGEQWRIRKADLVLYLARNRRRRRRRRVAGWIRLRRRGRIRFRKGVFLRPAVRQAVRQKTAMWHEIPEVLAEEDREWLDVDLGGELPPYDWGPDGPPKGKPVRYVPGVGPVVEGGKDVR